MNIQFMFENGKGSVVNKYDYIVDEEQFPLKTLNSHKQYLAQLALKSKKEIKTMQVEKEMVKPCSDVIMRKTSVKQNYTCYCNQDKVRFFKLLFEKYLSVATAAKQLGIHIHTAQKGAKQKTGCSCILYKEHKNAILEYIDDNPSIVLDKVMKKLKQIFTELKVFKTTLFDFVKQHCNLSLKKAWLQPIDQNSKEKIQECLDWVSLDFLSFHTIKKESREMVLGK
ncbi:hypothetical protein BDF14DRAFT_1863550 [Spinellus fusiger]|nr:hypothetical protein BDF14DRAFT_1863550 [Spinellus fusiger]